MWPQVVTQTTGPYKATSGNRATDFDIGTLGCSMILDQDLALHHRAALDISVDWVGGQSLQPIPHYPHLSRYAVHSGR